uniref:Uncharacterized protein n=1 Tax=Panagrolaimus davidi TaxID=227884 RepID=A0A914RCL1_9BILA
MFNDNANPKSNQQPGFQSIRIQIDGRNDGSVTDKAANWSMPNNDTNSRNDPPPFFINSNKEQFHQQNSRFENAGFGKNDPQHHDHPGSLIGRIVGSVVDWAKRNDGTGYSNPDGTFSVQFNQQPGGGVYVKGDNHGSIFNTGRRE